MVEPSYADLERASSLCDLRRYPEAVRMLAATVASEPDNARAWCLMAQAKLGCGDPSGALQAATAAVAADPHEEWAQRLSSIALARLGRDAESLAAAREAVRCGPSSALPFVRLALQLRQAGQLEAAGQAAAQAVLLAPHSVDAHVARGAIEVSAGHRAEAEAAFRQALALDPQNTAAHNELARLQLRRSFLRPGSMAQAAGGFATAVQADPSAQESRHNLDLVLRSFLSRLSYLLFLVVYLDARGLAGASAVWLRLIPVALLAVPTGFAWRFVRGLRPPLRRYLRTLMLHHSVRFPVALDTVAVALVLAAAATPRHDAVGLAAIGGVATLIARLLLWTQISRSSRAARRAGGTRPVAARARWLHR